MRVFGVLKFGVDNYRLSGAIRLGMKGVVCWFWELKTQLLWYRDWNLGFNENIFK
jgi:hypothetical protein